MSAKRTTDERPDKRQAIVDAALELFAERGFHGTAVPLTAEKAGVGAGTIYRYFPSKEALVNEVYLQAKSDLCRKLQDGFPHEAPARAQFHSLWARALEFARERPRAFRFLEMHDHRPYLEDGSLARETEMLRPIYAFFARMREQQIAKPLPEHLLVALAWGAMVGVIKDAWKGYYELSPEVIDAAEGCCWEAIRR